MIAVIVYNVITMQELSYLADTTVFHAPSRHLRSSYRNLLRKDSANLVFTDCSFSQAVPAVWNNLPLICYLYLLQHAIADLCSLTTFKRLLKTELYKRTFFC